MNECKLFRNHNKKHGQGTNYYINEQRKYTGIEMKSKLILMKTLGEWADGIYHGKGIINYPNKSCFKG